MREMSLHRASPAPVTGVAGIVLASGVSRRFRAGNKLLVPIHGVPLVRRTVEAYVQSSLDQVLVVIGHQATEVRDALEGLRILPVHNPRYRHGQSSSLIAGLRALPAKTRAAVIGVADQPLLTPEVIDALVDTYGSSQARLAVPRYAKQRGNPVLFDASLFRELLQTSGDRGGRAVIERHPADIAWVDLSDAALAFDIDTPPDVGQVEELLKERQL